MDMILRQRKVVLLEDLILAEMIEEVVEMKEDVMIVGEMIEMMEVKDHLLHGVHEEIMTQGVVGIKVHQDTKGEEEMKRSWW